MVGAISMPNRLRPVILWVSVHSSCASSARITSASERLGVMGSETVGAKADAAMGKFMRSRWSCTRACSSLGQFHQQLDALGRARQASGHDHRILGRHQHLRGFGRPRRNRPAAARSATSFGMRRFFSRDRFFLQHAVGHDHHRLVAAASSRSCTRARPIRRSATSDTGVSSHLV